MIDYEDLITDRSKGQTSLLDFIPKEEKEINIDEENHL